MGYINLINFVIVVVKQFRFFESFLYWNIHRIKIISILKEYNLVCRIGGWVAICQRAICWKWTFRHIAQFLNFAQFFQIKLTNCNLANHPIFKNWVMCLKVHFWHIASWQTARIPNWFQIFWRKIVFFKVFWDVVFFWREWRETIEDTGLPFWKILISEPELDCSRFWLKKPEI